MTCTKHELLYCESQVLTQRIMSTPHFELSPGLKFYRFMEVIKNIHKV